MPEVHIQLTEQIFNQAKLRAVEAGFASLDEYIVEIVSEDVAQETENFDDRFTPKVVERLNQLQEEIKAGGTTYSETEVDAFLQERSRTWRESQAN